MRGTWASLLACPFLFAVKKPLSLSAANEHDLTVYRREHVGFVFQFYNLIPSLTARENVGLVTDIANDPLEPELALELVGLAEGLNAMRAVNLPE